ncbi:S41 family peptidase [Dethiothermospora halolimnae]|uniref:S41 family peptidase n=1 Tax=Dethiothermospora halolimnae TaxID=3114390 RepID=UPI003CCBF6FE
MIKNKKANKSKLRKIIENFLIVLLGIVTAFVFLIVQEYFHIRNDKLLVMKEDILTSYYNKENIKKVLKSRLGDDYKGDLQKDFENYIITMVLEDLSELEADKWKRYNGFKTEKWMNNFKKTREKRANELIGREINKEIYYINIQAFYDGITYEKFYSHMDELKTHKNLIIDLRDNSGGNFTDMKKIVDLLLKKGKIIYRLNSSDGIEKVYSEDERKLKFDEIVVLTNNNTASVSELFILALKGNLDNVTTLGVNTYGKSISYGIRRFEDDSGMLFITNKMEGPNSEKIKTNGIEPDIKIGHLNEYYKKIQSDNERKIVEDRDKKQQLDKAIEYIKGS